MAWYSQTWNWFNGAWHEGNPPLIGPRSHVSWLGSSVFDGARVFEGVMPDIDLHCARVNRSARTIGLEPTLSPDAIVELVREGVKKFAPGTALYVKPMYWGEAEGIATIAPDPASTQFCLSLFEAPMPVPGGLSIMKSSFRRPTLESMPTDSKAGALYPNNARVIREAREKGFDNALVCDALGNVAETGTSNVFMAKDGTVYTPYPNGTFLNGITRQRVIQLLRDDGVPVVEATLRYEDFAAADEIFISGNYSKVMPVLRIDSRDLQPGPFYRRARELYWAYAHGNSASKAA
ncbi:MULTISPECIES: branched-chain amino acid aminotransferase [Microvirga]|uniref:branched-chain amino acid aminotransferase n=1 Tax=Microvirga TaxID=186650 RepID=UPI001CFFAC07|nr:branched-chain amino acid aminotransferase [Microvirga lenta]MCB5176339.1 branched-chain amino acid aminotransferase [Microvirga lenta]